MLSVGMNNFIYNAQTAFKYWNGNVAVVIVPTKLPALTALAMALGKFNVLDENELDFHDYQGLKDKVVTQLLANGFVHQKLGTGEDGYVLNPTP
jgi:hypothetical protein